jgi:hypothetical protein
MQIRRGTPEYNQGLSERRVVGLGIPEANLSTKAYGEEDNMTPEQVKQLVEQTSQLKSGTEGKILKKLEAGDAGAKPARGHYLEQYRATVRSPVPVQC